MITADSRVYTLMVASFADSPHWLMNIVGQLSEEGMQLTMPDSVTMALQALDQHNLDAILLSYSPGSIEFLRQIQFARRAPIKILMADTPPNPQEVSLADIVLPPINAFYVLQQIEALQNHRREVQAIQQDKDEITLLKNAIVRNVSHELKTPLLQVKSAVALLAESNKGEDRITEMAVQATARLEGVINNITQLADILDINLGPVIVRESIDQAIRKLRRSWEHKSAFKRIQVHVEPNLPLVTAGKQGLGMVLQQLLDNALKFSDGEVQLSAELMPDGVRISVQDCGIGIAEHELEQIFESFYQVDSSSTRPYGGTGVGLAIVQLIADKHNVEIHVDSTLGEGSTFWFLLPISKL